MLSNSFKSLPKYLGSCGRLIVESKEGLTLNKFLDHPFKDRVICNFFFFCCLI
jgi:hypothetical protein